MNSSLFLCHAHLYASALSMVRGFSRDTSLLFVAVLSDFVSFPELSGWTFRIAVARCRTHWKRFSRNVIATQITLLRLLPICRFVKEKRPFPGDFTNFWILYQYFPRSSPALYHFFSHSHKNTIVRHYRTPHRTRHTHAGCVRDAAPYRVS